jgi:hypothetical protein
MLKTVIPIVTGLAFASISALYSKLVAFTVLLGASRV